MPAVAVLLLLFTGLLSVLAYLAKVDGAFEALCHFRFHYLLVQVLCLTVLGLFNRRKWVVIALFFIFLNLIHIWPYLLPHNQDKSSVTNTFTVLQMNLNISNQQHDKVLGYINEINPDILACEEVTSTWAVVLNQALQTYPYRIVMPKETPFGIALFSKIPLEKAQISYFGEKKRVSPEEMRNYPSLIADLEIGQELITVIVTHPMPPVVDMELRNNQLSGIAQKRAEYQDNLVVVGDLNSTPWSPFFQQFIQKTELRDSQLGYGIQASWKSPLPMVSLPIDHVLTSSRLKVLKRQLGPDVGSDHYPVFVELGLSENSL